MPKAYLTPSDPEPTITGAGRREEKAVGAKRMVLIEGYGGGENIHWMGPKTHPVELQVDQPHPLMVSLTWNQIQLFCRD